jgi:hypothetical protein
MLAACRSLTSTDAEGAMSNVNMPVPVALAGAALCLLGGFLVGTVAGPDAASRSTAEVEGYERGTNELCLSGEAVRELPEAEGGVLCGTWRHERGAQAPEAGDTFRFVTLSNTAAGDGEAAVFIYGDVVR